MATVIRLKRIGAKKDPVFRIVVADSRARRDGRFVEQLGFYNAQPKEAEVRVDMERAAYWLGVGAKPSDQVRSLFKKVGVALPAAPSRPKKKVEAAKPKKASAGASAREKARRERKRAARAEKKAVLAKKDAKVKAEAKAAAAAAAAAEAEPAASAEPEKAEEKQAEAAE